MKSQAEQYIATVLEATIDESATCPVCDGTGLVDTRHPELDDDLMAVVWLVEFCDCQAGQVTRDAYEDEVYDC
jgi:hypothetical protein